MEEKKAEYLESIYIEFERRGLCREDATTVMNASGFIPALNKDPELLMGTSVSDRVDELLVVVATLLQVQKKASIPRQKISSILKLVLDVIKSNSKLIQEYMETKKKLVYGHLMEDIPEFGHGEIDWGPDIGGELF